MMVSLVHDVAGNDGERFSATGFGVPAQHRDHLVATASARVARKLADEFGAQAATVAVTKAGAPLSSALGGELISLAEAEAAVEAWLRAKGAGQPDEADLVGWLGEGRVMEALVGLARAAAMPPEMVLRAYQGAHADPLLFLVRSLRYGWGTFKAFLVSKTGKEGPPEEMRGLFEAFQALSVPTAQRVVRFTSAREQMQKAG